MKVVISVVAAILAAVLGSAAAAGAPPPLSLADAVAQALAANPTLAAARLGLGAARAGVDLAAARPDPDLLLEESRETPRDALSLDLPIETGGKRRRRVDLADAELAGAVAAVHALEMETRNQVRRSYYAVVAARDRYAVSQQRLELAERALAATRARFEAGAAPRLEVLQTELATAETTSETGDRRAALDAASAALLNLLGQPPGEPLTVSGELGDGAAPDAAALVERALAANAELALADQRVAEGEARVALARAGKVPDVTLSLGVTHNSLPEFDYGWRGALGLTLPISGRHRAEVVVEEQRVAQLQGERRALAARVRGDVAAAAALAEVVEFPGLHEAGERPPLAVSLLLLGRERSPGVGQDDRVQGAVIPLNESANLEDESAVQRIGLAILARPLALPVAGAEFPEDFRRDTPLGEGRVAGVEPRSQILPDGAVHSRFGRRFALGRGQGRGSGGRLD